MTVATVLVANLQLHLSLSVGLIQTTRSQERTRKMQTNEAKETKALFVLVLRTYNRLLCSLIVI